MFVTGTLSAAALTNGRNAVAIMEDESSCDHVFGRLMDLTNNLVIIHTHIYIDVVKYAMQSHLITLYK